MLKYLLQRLTRGTSIQIDADAWSAAVAALPFLGRLTPDESARLRALAGEFLGSKQMSAAAQLQLTAPMQISIAAQACLPILELGLHWYDGWTGIVVYPDEFVVPREVTDEAGVVHSFEETLSGEAWDGGPLLLSWADASQHGEASLAYNVVIHEFAHKLDMLNGDADGVPPFDRRLHPDLSAARWRSTLEDAYERLHAEVELVEASLPAGVDPESEDADPYYARLPLDVYAAKEPGEFFAVSSEAFFVAPQRLAAAFPDWYAQLAAFYRQNPLQRLP